MPIQAFEGRCPIVAALFRAPLLGFVRGRLLGLGEEVDLLGNDLAAVASLAAVIGPAGVVDPSGDHDHRAFGNVLGDALSDAIEAGDPVQLCYSRLRLRSRSGGCPRHP